MFAGTALSVRLFVCAGLSLFIIYGPYLYVVVCVFYAYNLTLALKFSFSSSEDWIKFKQILNRYWDIALSPMCLFECIKSLQYYEITKRCSHLPFYIDLIIDLQCASFICVL